jgi:hypothetical protein
VNCPASTQPGDFVGVWFVANDGFAPTPPSGYTNVISGGDLDGNGDFFYYHFQQPGDPTSVSFGYRETVSLSAICAVYSGVNTTNPIDAFNSQANTVSTTIVSPSITTATANDELLMLYNLNAIGTVSSPSVGTIEQQETFGGEILAWVDKPLTTPGATGNQSIQFPVVKDSFTAQIAIAQAAPGACVAPTSTKALTPGSISLPGGLSSLSTRGLNFGTMKAGKVHKLSFTIKNTAKAMLYGDVNVSGLPTPLSVTAGAGPFMLGHNEVHRVTVEAAPTAAAPIEAGIFAGAINVDFGNPKYRTVSVIAKGRRKD